MPFNASTGQPCTLSSQGLPSAGDARRHSPAIVKHYATDRYQSALSSETILYDINHHELPAYARSPLRSASGWIPTASKDHRRLRRARLDDQGLERHIWANSSRWGIRQSLGHRFSYRELKRSVVLVLGNDMESLSTGVLQSFLATRTTLPRGDETRRPVPNFISLVRRMVTDATPRVLARGTLAACRPASRNRSRDGSRSLFFRCSEDHGAVMSRAEC